MTNKLPKVGKRYRGLISKYIFTLLTIREDRAILESEKGIEPFDIATFWDYFKELPEDNQTSKKNLQVELSKEVLEAMGKAEEELKTNDPFEKKLNQDIDVYKRLKDK